MLLSMFGRDAWESVYIAVRQTANYEVPMISAVRKTANYEVQMISAVRKTANYEVPMISAVRKSAKCEVPMISAGSKSAYHRGYLEMTVWFLKNKTIVSIDVSL